MFVALFPVGGAGGDGTPKRWAGPGLVLVFSATGIGMSLLPSDQVDVDKELPQVSAEPAEETTEAQQAPERPTTIDEPSIEAEPEGEPTRVRHARRRSPNPDGQPD